MKPDVEIGDLGDIPPKVFRKHLHEIADWIADYRENISNYRISPTVRAGAIVDALPAIPPEEPESLDQILSDFNQVLLPGVMH